MARNLAYYLDPEEERRKQALIEEQFGPPPPPPNLGVAPVPRHPLDMATPRATDRSYADMHDPYQDEEPTAEELAADAAAEEEDARAAREVPPHVAANREGDERKLDILLDHNPYAPGPNLGDWASQLRMDPRAAADLERAPTPVDKTAASVSAEQKGVPATLTAPERTDEELAQPGARVGAVVEALANQPPASTRDYSQTADRMNAPNQRGERSDFLGFDDEEGFSRQKAIQRVRELYGDGEAPGHQWEDEFLANHKRRSDTDIDRAWLLQSLWSGNERGDRVREMFKRDQQGFEQGLAGARNADLANARISPAMAEAIAATGQVSPEEAVNLRMSDPLVKNFGQFASQGGRSEGQNIGLMKEKLKLATQLLQSEDKGDRERGLAILRAATQLDVADIYANKGQPNTPEARAASANAASSLMAQALGPNVALAQGEAALKGDYRGLTAEQARKAAIVGPQILAKAGRPEGLGRVLDDSIRAHATQPVKDELAIQKSIELIRRNPEKAREWQEKWTTAQIPLKNALSGWRAMSPAAKTALATWTQTNKDGSAIDLAHLGDQWQKYNDLTPEDQIHVSRVLGAINEYVKANAGSAVTGSEWDRIAHRVGMATGTWAPFNNPEVIGQFLIDAAKAMNQNRADYERIMGGWK